MNKKSLINKEYKDYFAKNNLGLKIPKLPDQVFLYDSNKNLVGAIITYEEFLAARIYIAKNKFHGWYFMFGVKKISIDCDGRITDWPKGFFDQAGTLHARLFSIQRERMLDELDTIDKLLKVLRKMELSIGDKISLTKFFITAQIVGLIPLDQFVDFSKSKHYLNILREKGYVSMTGKKYFMTTKLYYEKNSNS
jgi:hypothetical protein